MGSSACSINSYHAASGGSSWSDSTYFYSGKSGDYVYRSKVAITTPAFSGPSTKLIVGITLSGKSSPRGCYGVLHSSGDFAPGKVVADSKDKNGVWDGPHPDLTAACIAQSYACSNTSGTRQDGYNQESGTTFYFIFDTSALRASTTYWLYAMKYVGWQTSSNGGWDTSSGWTQANQSGISATVYYNDMYYLDVNGRLDGADAGGLSGSNGTPYGTCDVYVNGSRVANDIGNHYTQYVYGSTYEIKDIKATTGHTYAGVVGGSASGTITGNTGVRLAFNTNSVNIYYHPNGAIVSNTSYGQNQYGWVTRNGSVTIDTVSYGGSTDPTNATTFGLVKPGYSFGGWLLDSNGGDPPYSGVWTILNQDTVYDSTVYHQAGDINKTTATAGAGNIYCYLSATWTPNNYTYTLDAMGGAVSSTSVSAPYSNGTYALPTPTKNGYKFKGWYADIGANGPIDLGLDYKFDGATGIAVQLDAYMNDWSTISTATLISCTNGGGWNLWFSNGVLLAEIYDSGISGYRVIDTGLRSNQLRPGWHQFKLVISNNTTLGCSILVDSSQCGGTVTLSGGLGYASAQNMTLWLGAESSHTTGVYDGHVFPGYIRHFSIENKYSGVTALSANTFATPCQNITLYADWEPCETAYVKVDNRWRKGTMTFKDNNAWMPPSNAANQPPNYVVHTPSGASYGFALNANGFYESTNNGVSNSASVARVDFYTDGTKKMLVECINYAESNYDFGILSNIGTSLTLTSTEDTTNVKKSFKGSQSASIQTVDYGTVAAGNRSFYIKYRKDSSANHNNDSLQFRIVFYY